MGTSIGILDSNAESDYQVSVYGDLASITDQLVGDIAVVETTSGGLFGIGSKEAGAYRWNGTDWEYFSQSLKDEIKQNEDDIALLITNSIQSVTGTAVDNTDPQNPIIDNTGNGDTIINNSKLYKAFSLANPNINLSTTHQTLNYDAAASGTYDATVFTPVANGVQLLKDLENVTVYGSVYVIATDGIRVVITTAINIDGVPSNVEGGGYIRRASGSNEDSFNSYETYPELSAGTVITFSGKRDGGTSNTASGIAGKGILSVLGFEPTNAGAITGFPTPVITSITTS